LPKAGMELRNWYRSWEKPNFDLHDLQPWFDAHECVLLHGKKDFVDVTIPKSLWYTALNVKIYLLI